MTVQRGFFHTFISQLVLSKAERGGQFSCNPWRTFIGLWLVFGPFNIVTPRKKQQPGFAGGHQSEVLP